MRGLIIQGITCLLQEVICAVMAFFHVPIQRYNVGAQLMSIKPEFSTAGLQYAIDNTKVQLKNVKIFKKLPPLLV